MSKRSALVLSIAVVFGSLLGPAPGAYAGPTVVPVSGTSSAPSPGPAVSGVRPATGIRGGGDAITITGSGFTEPAQVFLGSAPADDVHVVSPTQITATAPPGTGTVDVVVRGPQSDSPATAADRFTYVDGPGLVPVAPVRVVDTRQGIGAVGPGRTVSIDLSTRVPVGATAVVLTLTGVGPTTGTFLTAYASGTPRPATSNLNLPPRSVLATQATVRLGDTRSITVYNAAGSIDVVADLTGYMIAGGAVVVPHSSFRIYDSRTSRTPIGPGGTVRVDIAQGGVVPVAATLTLTGIAPTASTYLTAWAGGSRPTTSSLNVARGSVLAATVTTPVGPDGYVSIYNAAGSVNLAVDLDGSWVPPALDCACAGTYVGSAPTRVLDTRTTSHPVEAGATVAVDASSAVPADTIAVVGTLTGVAPSASTYLAALPFSGPPATSNLNLPAGAIYATEILVPAPRGRFTIFNARGTTNVVFDLTGYVRAGGVVAIPGQPAAATLGRSFSLPLRAVRGQGPYSWAVAPGGSLPPGLAVHGAAISGTPTESGMYATDLIVSDATGGGSLLPVHIEVVGAQQAGWSATSAPLPPDVGPDAEGRGEVYGSIWSNLGEVSCPTMSFCVAVGTYSVGGADLATVVESGAPGAMTAAVPPTPAGVSSVGAVGVACAGADGCSIAFNATRSDGTHVSFVDDLRGGTWSEHDVPAPPAPDLTDTGLVVTALACPEVGSCELAGYLTGNREGLPSTDPVVIDDRQDVFTGHVVTPAATSGRTYDGGSFAALSCPTASSCVAVGSFLDRDVQRQDQGHALVAEAGTALWSVVAAGGGQDSLDGLTSLSCWAVHSCAALAHSPTVSDEYLVDILTPGVVGGDELSVETAPESPDHAMRAWTRSGVQRLTCTGGGYCLLAAIEYDANPNPRTYVDTRSNGRWVGADLPLPPDEDAVSGGGPADATCTSAGSCVVVGGGFQGRTEIWTSSNGVWTVGDAPLAHGLHDAGAVGTPQASRGTRDRGILAAVSCPTSTSCVAVGQQGYYLGGQATSVPSSGTEPLVATISR